MADKNKAKDKQPEEKGAGKFHYNPGNMSGKTVEIGKDESEQQNNADRIESRHQQQEKKE